MIKLLALFWLVHKITIDKKLARNTFITAAVFLNIVMLSILNYQKHHSIVINCGTLFTSCLAIGICDNLRDRSANKNAPTVSFDHRDHVECDLTGAPFRVRRSVEVMINKRCMKTKAATRWFHSCVEIKSQ